MLEKKIILQEFHAVFSHNYSYLSCLHTIIISLKCLCNTHLIPLRKHSTRGSLLLMKIIRVFISWETKKRKPTIMWKEI